MCHRLFWLCQACARLQAEPPTVQRANHAAVFQPAPAQRRVGMRASAAQNMHPAFPLEHRQPHPGHFHAQAPALWHVGHVAAAVPAAFRGQVKQVQLPVDPSPLALGFCLA